MSRKPSSYCLAALFVCGCGEAITDSSLETGKTSQAACANEETTATIWLPSHLDFDDVVVSAMNSAKIRTFADVLTGWITSIGNGGVNLGNDAEVSSVASIKQVVLGDRVKLTGYLDTNTSVIFGANDVYTAANVNQQAGITAESYNLGLAVFYELQAGKTIDNTLQLVPGYYGPTIVNGTLEIGGDGKYRFQSLTVNGTLKVTNGHPRVWVDNDLVLNGYVTGTSNASPNLVLLSGGTADVRLFHGFAGYVIAPKAKLELQGTTSYYGFFYGKSVDVFDSAIVSHRPFDPLAFFDVITGENQGPSCFDGVQNQSETGPDCGGPCDACVVSFQMSTGNTVYIEGESFQESSANGSADSWTVSNDSTASNSKVAVVGPDDGTTWTSNVETTAPRVSYNVNFYSAGTFNFWIRGKAAHGANDSCHAGLNGSNTIPFYDFPENSTLTWIKQTVTVSVPGIHTINIWGREDGFILDKIKITKDSATPLGAEGAESPKL